MNRIHFEDLSPETIDGVDKVASILEGTEGLELYRYRIYNQEYEYFFNFLICLNGGNKLSVNIPMADLFEIEQESGNVEKDVVIYILDLLIRKLVEANIVLEESEDNRVKTELDQVKTELEDCEDYISREQALKALGEAPYVWTDSDAELQAYEDWRTIKEMLEGLPSIAPKEPKAGWNNHQIACMLADLFGDTCACNYNGNDEWLSEICDFKDTYCPNPVGVACWEQFLKYSQSRYTECGCEAKDKNALQEPYKESEE